MIPLFRYRNTCLVDTAYALSVYLLYTDDAIGDKTMFICGPGVPKVLVDKLPHKIYLEGTHVASPKECKAFRRKSLFTWPFRRFTNLYAQDHVWLFNAIIGTQCYTYIEDCPEVYTKCHDFAMQEPIERNDFRWRFWAFRNFGTTYRHPLGYNSQCVNRIITSPRDLDSKYLRGRKYTLLDYKRAYQTASPQKQQFIRNVFSISDDILHQLSSSEVIIFTQPFTTDCGLSEEEQVRLYAPYIEKYIDQGLIIKPHPRDNVDYCKYYPQVHVINTKAPMQLLEAFEMNIKVAITVCSTAVSCLVGKAEIIWIGSEVDSRLIERFGHQKNPYT